MVLHVYPESGRRDLRTVEARQSGTNLDGQKRYEVRNSQHILSSSAQGICGAGRTPEGHGGKKKKLPLGSFFLWCGAVGRGAFVPIGYIEGGDSR